MRRIRCKIYFSLCYRRVRLGDGVLVFVLDTEGVFEREIVGVFEGVRLRVPESDAVLDRD